jgi:hypothetical protein
MNDMKTITVDEEIEHIIQRNLIPGISAAQDEILKRFGTLVYFTIDWETVELPSVPKDLDEDIEEKKPRLLDMFRINRA